MEEFVFESKEEALEIIEKENILKEYMFSDVFGERNEQIDNEIWQNLDKKAPLVQTLSVKQLNILYNTLQNPQTAREEAALDNLMSGINSKLKDYAASEKNELDPADIEPMISLIQKCSNNSQLKQSDTQELYQAALQKVLAYASAYDKENNLDNMDNKKISLYARNFEKMSYWQTDVTSLDETPENKMVKIPGDKLYDFVKNQVHGKDNASYSTLASALSAAITYNNKELRAPIIKQTIEKIKGHIKERKIIPISDIEGAKYISGMLSKDKAYAAEIKGFEKVISCSIEHDKKLKVFENIDNIVSNTEIMGKRRLFGRDLIKQTNDDKKLLKDSDLAIWLESVRGRTVCQLLGSPNLTKEQFNDRFADNVVGEYLSMVSTGKELCGENKKSVFKKLFKSIGKNKKIKIDQDIVIASTVNTNNQTTGFISRLTDNVDKEVGNPANEKFNLKTNNNFKTALKGFKKWMSECDLKATERWGDKYLYAKGFVQAVSKQSKWAMAFSAAKVTGVVLGSPYILPAVAAASFANTCVQFGKDYSAAKKKAQKNNKNLTLAKYCSQNKTRLASMALSGFVTAATFGSIGGGNAVTSAILNGKVFASGGIAAVKCAERYNSVKDTKGKARAAFEAAFVAATAVGSYAVSHFASNLGFEGAKSISADSQTDMGHAVDSTLAATGKGKDNRNNSGKKRFSVISTRPQQNSAPRTPNNTIARAMMSQSGRT